MESRVIHWFLGDDARSGTGFASVRRSTESRAEDSSEPIVVSRTLERCLEIIGPCLAFSPGYRVFFFSLFLPKEVSIALPVTGTRGMSQTQRSFQTGRSLGEQRCCGSAAAIARKQWRPFTGKRRSGIIGRRFPTITAYIGKTALTAAPKRVETYPGRLKRVRFVCGRKVARFFVFFFG